MALNSSRSWLSAGSSPQEEYRATAHALVGFNVLENCNLHVSALRLGLMSPLQAKSSNHLLVHILLQWHLECFLHRVLGGSRHLILWTISGKLSTENSRRRDGIQLDWNGKQSRWQSWKSLACYYVAFLALLAGFTLVIKLIHDIRLWMIPEVLDLF